MKSNLPPGVRDSDIPGNRPGDAAWDNLYGWIDEALQNAGIQGSDAQVEQLTNAFDEKLELASRGNYTEGRVEAELDFERNWNDDGGPVYFARLPEFIQKDLLDRFQDEHDNYLRGQHKNNAPDMMTLREYVEKKCMEHDASAVFEWWVEWKGVINLAPAIIQAFLYITKALYAPPKTEQPAVDPCFLKGDAWWFSLPDNDEPQGPFPSQQEANEAREIALRLVA